MCCPFLRCRLTDDYPILQIDAIGKTILSNWKYITDNLWQKSADFYEIIKTSELYKRVGRKRKELIRRLGMKRTRKRHMIQDLQLKNEIMSEV